MKLYVPTNQVTRHLLFWLGIVLLFGLIPIISPAFCFCDLPIFLTELFFLNLPTFISYTYVLAYGLIPLVFRRQFGWFVGGLVLLHLASWFFYDLLLYGWQYVMTEWFHQSISFHVDTWLFSTKFPGNAFRETNLTAGLFVCLKLFSSWQQKQTESQRLEQEKLQTELQLLKLQLAPDFLFGSLHSLHRLSQQQSRQAPEVALKLVHFLRYILYESQARLVPLAWEMDVIEQYIFIQKAMHPADLEISFSVRGNLDNRTITPLVLFPVVENAFRTLPLDLVQPTWVSIDLAISEAQLSLKVVSELTDSASSTTLNDLQKQLLFYYGDRYHLQIWQEGEINVVTLTISFPTNSLKPTSLSAHPIDTIR